MKKIFAMAALAALLAGCAGRNIDVPVEASGKVLEELAGNYTLKTTVEDSVRYSTAVVTEIAKGEYQITRVTVYGPVIYGFKLGEHAAVESAELGSGQVTYQKKIKKTTIRFEKGGALCELSK